MKGLLVKDLRLLCSQSRFYVILLLVLILAGTSTDATFVAGYISIIFPMFAVSTISYDEYDNGNAFLFTLPFSRKEYVLSKYLFGLLLCLFGTLLSTILIVVQNVFILGSLDLEAMISSQTGTMVSAVLILSFMFPLQFKFGSEKSRIALIAVVGIVFFLITVGVKLLEHVSLDLSFLSFIWNNEFILLSILFVVMIVFIYISIHMSIRIMIKKEF